MERRGKSNRWLYCSINVGYNQDINLGETVTFAYNAIKNNHIQLPDNFILINDYLLVKHMNYDFDFCIENHYWILNDGNSQNILPGESVTFSFQVTNAVSKQEPAIFR